MSWFDRYVIAPLAPLTALRRLQAQRAVKAYYEQAIPSRLRKAVPLVSSANQTTHRAGESLRAQARQLEENFDIAKGALDTLVANIVGTGIQPEPQVKSADGTLAKAVNDQLLKLWNDWIKNPEVTGQMDYYTSQRMACRSWLRDGEVLTQLITGGVAGLDHGTKVPFSIELLEADFLPFQITNPQQSTFNGIQINSWGRPIVYNLWKVHPGDVGFTGEQALMKQVSAGRIIHLKLVNRLHQLRGITIFASVIGRFADIKEIDESERVAARVAAAMAAYIKKGMPDMYQAPMAVDGIAAPSRTMDFAPGMVFDDLLPGEDIGTINPNRPNNALIPFRDSQLRSGSAGVTVSFSSLSKNYNGTYSAQRQELVEQYQHYRVMSDFFIEQQCKPVWAAFVNAAIAARLIKFDTGSVDMTTITDASHVPPQMPWIDPVKEATANALLEDRLYKSRSEIIRERGGVPDETLQEIKRDQDEANRLGLAPRITNPSASPKTEDANAPTEPDGGPAPTEAEPTDAGKIGN